MRNGKRPGLHTVLGLGLSAVFGGCGMPAADTASAQESPAIAWSTPSIEARVIAGRSITVTVQARALKPVRRVSLVADSHADLLTIAPPVLRVLEAGETRTVTITFDPPSAAKPDVARRVGSIVAQAGGAPKSLPLSFKLVVLGLGDLAGPDEDDNGVWDNIDRYIGRNFPPDTRDAAQQFAAALQNAVLASGDRGESLRNARAIDRSIECLRSLRGPGMVSHVAQLKAAVLNNFARHFAYIEFSRQVAGSTSQSAAAGGGSCT